ncbi:MAG: hypothetical protein R6X33_05020 [Candidatus Brocadiia bacterium]
MRKGISRTLLVLAVGVALSAGVAFAAPDAPAGPEGAPRAARPARPPAFGLGRLFAHEATDVDVKPTDDGARVAITSDNPEVVERLHAQGLRRFMRLQRGRREAGGRQRPAQAPLMGLMARGDVEVRPRKTDEGIVLDFTSSRPGVRKALQERLPRMAEEARERARFREDRREREYAPEARRPRRGPEAAVRRRRPREPGRQLRRGEGARRAVPQRRAGRPGRDHMLRRRGRRQDVRRPDPLASRRGLRRPDRGALQQRRRTPRRQEWARGRAPQRPYGGRRMMRRRMQRRHPGFTPAPQWRRPGAAGQWQQEARRGGWRRHRPGPPAPAWGNRRALLHRRRMGPHGRRPWTDGPR